MQVLKRGKFPKKGNEITGEEQSFERLVKKDLISDFSPDQTRFSAMGAKTLPCAIKQIYIESYQEIEKNHIVELPLDAQWIFLTGENGFGKSCFLQAVVIGLYGKQDGKTVLADQNCQVAIELKNFGENQINQSDCAGFQKFSLLSLHIVSFPF